MLGDRAYSNMNARESSTLTDADVHDAYREILKSKSDSREQRIAGDALMIFGGVITPMWTTSPLMTFAGILLIVAGLYVRERSAV